MLLINSTSFFSRPRIAFFSTVVTWCFRTNILKAEHEKTIQTCPFGKWQTEQTEGQKQKWSTDGPKESLQKMLQISSLKGL